MVTNQPTNPSNSNGPMEDWYWQHLPKNEQQKGGFRVNEREKNNKFYA